VAQRSRLFQHLTQADSFTTPKHGGTALGLITCSQLVALMGGRIEAESGRGPASRADLQRCDSGPVRGSGRQAAARGLLTRLACDVGAPANGQGAIRLFAAGGYDLLVDCAMPGLDVYEASAEIRRIEPAGGGPRSWQ
jgi:signal transduction histidine kinase